MAQLPKEKDIYQPESTDESAGAILIVTGNDTEDLEFFYPYYRFIEAGYRVDVATPDGGEFKGKHGLSLRRSLEVEDVVAEDYDLLYLPGGKAPAQLKSNEAVLDLTKAFVDEGKPIAAVCHGPQILAAAGVIDGRKIAAWPEVEDELISAGATFVDQETAEDGNFITARWPGDLPAHLKKTLAKLGKSRQQTGEAEGRHASAGSRSG